MKTVVVALAYLVGLVPRSVLHALGRLIGLFWFYVLRFRVKLIESNLKIAFPEKSDAEIRKLARANCMHFGMMLFDVLVSIAWTAEDYRRIPLEGKEHLEKALEKGKGAFVLCMHLGCWEYTPSVPPAHGLPFDLIIKRTQTQWMTDMLEWSRTKTGARTFPEEGIGSQILGSLAQNRAIGFVVDQFMGPPIGLPVKFFGRLAGTAVGLALFSEKRDAPVLLLYNYRDGDGRPRAVLTPPIEWSDLPRDRNDRLYYKTQVFNDMYEKIIRLYPEQWLWMHRRWKEYRGEPRWKPAMPQIVLATVMAFITACASAPATTQIKSPTGSPVPAEPALNIPKGAPVQEPLGNTEATLPQSTVSVTAPEKETKSKKKAAPKPTEKKVVLRKFHPQDLPFEVGERQVMDLNWTMLPAGRITLEVRPNADKEFGGRPTFHFWGQVRSSKIVDAIYKVDNVIQSFVDKEWFLPYKFLLTMDEKMQFKETRVVFDHPANKAHYWSDRKSERWGNEVQNRVDNIQTNALDMFAAMYYARLLNFKLGERQEYRIYENNKNLSIVLDPVANEVVQTPVGTFQCWKLKTTILLDNVLKPTGDMYAWLSDDFKKYLVKFDAQLKIGSLKGTLVELRDRNLAGK